MKNVLTILMILITAGCSSQNASQQVQREDKFIDRVSIQDVEHASRKFQELRPGMTSKQVFAVLGLFPTNMFCSGSGGKSCYTYVYSLRRGCGLWLSLDYRTNSDGTLIRAILDDGKHEQVVGTLP